MSESDSFFVDYDGLSDDELIEKVNRNRRETEEHDREKLDD